MGSGIPVVMVAMNVVYSLSLSIRQASRYDVSYPTDGHRAVRADHIRRCAARQCAWGAVLVGVAFWACRLLATMAGRTAPPGLRGTAFGFLNPLNGAVTLASSVIAGMGWDRLGASTKFYAGAVSSTLAVYKAYRSKAALRS